VSSVYVNIELVLSFSLTQYLLEVKIRNNRETYVVAADKRENPLNFISENS
jgi:hypothetical protein